MFEEEAEPQSSYQDELAAAVAEASLAELALRSNISPDHPAWHPGEEAAYRQRFERWRKASRDVVAALDRLGQSRARR